jgi:hypothetical protein
VLALKLHRPGEALRAPGTDLDLRSDQLPGCRFRQQLVAKAGGVEVVEAVAQLEALRIDYRELLFEADREVGRGIEQLPYSLQVEVASVLGVRATSALYRDVRTSPSIKSRSGARRSRPRLASGQVEVQGIQ